MNRKEILVRVKDTIKNGTAEYRREWRDTEPRKPSTVPDTLREMVEQSKESEVQR